MAGKLESSIERRVSRDVLEDFGVPNVKLLHEGGETGWPDRLYLIPGGRPLLIEYKRPSKNPAVRLKQEYIHGILQGLGYDVEVHNTYEEAYNSIRKAVDATRLSKAGRKVSRRTSSRRAAGRSRAG